MDHRYVSADNRDLALIYEPLPQGNSGCRQVLAIGSSHEEPLRQQLELTDSKALHLGMLFLGSRVQRSLIPGFSDVQTLTMNGVQLPFAQQYHATKESGQRISIQKSSAAKKAVDIRLYLLESHLAA